MRRSDEIGDLAETFREMASNLQRTTVSRDFLDNIIGNMLEVLVVTGPDGRITLFNRAACALLGYEIEELINTDILEIVVAEESES